MRTIVPVIERFNRLDERWGCWGQEELAPSTGNRHLQLLIRTPSKGTYNQVVAQLRLGDPLLPPHLGDFRVVWTTPYAAYRYVVREDKRAPNGHVIDIGTAPAQGEVPDISRHARESLRDPGDHDGSSRQGQRTDLIAFIGQVKEGRSWDYMVQHYPELCFRYEKACRSYFRQFTPPRDFRTDGLYITGKTGTGKTTTILSLYPGAYWCTWTRPFWMDEYNGQETVVFDEMSPDFFDPVWYNRLLDKTPCLVPVKCGFTQFKAKLVIFASNYTVNQMFACCTEDVRAAAKRRLGHYLIFTRTTQGIRVLPLSLPAEGRAPIDVADLATQAGAVLRRPQPIAPPAADTPAGFRTALEFEAEEAVAQEPEAYPTKRPSVVSPQPIPTPESEPESSDENIPVVTEISDDSTPGSAPSTSRPILRRGAAIRGKRRRLHF
jgi:hypothetical protein